MRIVFISNFLSHHQQPISRVLAELCDYTFLATQPVSEERMAMGWTTEEPSYLCHYSLDQARAHACLEQADVVIAGNAPEELVQSAIRRGCLVFRCHERPLKKGTEWLKAIPRFVKWHIRNPKEKPVYLLCASAFTAADYARFGLFHNKVFQWGYFPETKRYTDVDALLKQKEPNSILWCGRFLDLKHPEHALAVTSKLKANGYAFTLNIIGTGPQEAALQEQVRQAGLCECVHFLGTMSPQQVRSIMERTKVFLFTSDRNEGWGAVLNEAMNSGCAVVASDAIGAVPYLIGHKTCGLVYPSGDVDQLYERVRFLLEHPDDCLRIGKKAYLEISEKWNEHLAAQRLVQLIDVLLKREDPADLFEDGPCSPAQYIADDWYRCEQK